MKIIQTFWTGNAERRNPLAMNGGWTSPEYNWMSWALSCLQLKKFYGEVELFTDTLGKKILIDILRLPYSKVSVTLDNVLDSYPNEVWALSKIHTYSCQQEPFIHFDGDLFLWEPIPEDLFNSKILVQNKEMDLAFYRLTLDAINTVFSYLPTFCVKEFYDNKPIVSINAGIIGGTDLGFFKRYRQAAFDFVSRNSDHLHKIRTDNLNFIFEQYFLYCLAEETQTPIRHVSDKIVEDLLYGEYVNFSRIPEIKFIHPVSGHKRNVHVCDNLSRTMRLEYPEVYEFILDTVHRSGIALSNKAYTTNNELRAGDSLMQDVDFYKRTNALIRHLSSIKKVDQPVGAVDLEKQNDFDDVANSLAQTDEELQLLSELYQVEKTKKQIFFKVYGNKNDLRALCVNDAKRYTTLKEVFRLQSDEIAQIEISRNPNVNSIPVTTDWICPDTREVEEMIKYKYENIQRIHEHILFVPKITRMELDEYMLDGLDGILFNYCADGKPIKDILEHVSAYFEKEEIAENYSAFEHLIIDSLSRLCYLDVLDVKN